MISVLPGTYQESVYLDHGGSAVAPMVVQGEPGAVLESPDPSRSLSAFDLDAGAAYVRIEGFEARGGYAESVFVRPGVHDVELVALDIHHNRNGIWIQGASRVSVRKCTVHENGRAAIRIFDHAESIDFSDTVSRDNDDGQGCNGDADGFCADESVSNLRFERVTASGNAEDGFDLKAANVSILRAYSIGNGCSGMKLWNDAYVENALIQANKTGITAAGAAGARIVVHNATVTDNATGVRGDGDGFTLELRNSIIAGPGKAISYQHGIVLIEDYDILFRPTSGSLIEQFGDGGETIFTADDVNSGYWNRAMGQGAHTLSLDPRLAEGIPYPEKDSPALDSGADDGSPPDDLLGSPRPVGGGIDRGACERPLDVSLLTDVKIHLARRGGGRDSLRLQAWLPPAALPLLDATGSGIWLQVTAGDTEALSVFLPPAALRLAGGSITTRQRSRQLRLSLHPRHGGLSLHLTAFRLDLDSLPPGPLDVDLRCGALETSASAMPQ